MAYPTHIIQLVTSAILCLMISSSSSENVLTSNELQLSNVEGNANERIRRSTNSLGSYGYENDFLEKLLDKYGENGMVSISQLRNMVNNIKLNLRGDGHVNEHVKDVKSDTDSGVAVVDDEPVSSDAPRHDTVEMDCSDEDGCKSNKCLSMVKIFEHHSLVPSDTVNGSSLERMSPTILYQLQNPDCKIHGKAHTDYYKIKPDAGAVWGYGFLCVTLINLCSLMGMAFMPLMHRSFYKNMLLFMVALAVGTLTGSGLLFLIPESFEMTRPDSPHNDIYVWRCTTVIGGIYLFFLIERLLKMIMKYKQNKSASVTVTKVSANAREQAKLKELPIASVPTHSGHMDESMNVSFELPATVSGNVKNTDCLIPNNDSTTRFINHENAATETDVNIQMRNGQSAQSSPQHQGHSHGADLCEVRSVAWMVIFGDGLHNFIDGLSIGAAFSGSIMTGFSVSLAVFCEELPHELGDFAILLNSGMSMKQALSYNFLSACMCYLGLIVGTILSNATGGAVYIFAVAGGMFLYIALVDMLPEVNHAADEEEARTGAKWSIFLIQNAGLLTGIGIMLLLAIFSGKIDLRYLEQ